MPKVCSYTRCSPTSYEQPIGMMGSFTTPLVLPCPLLDTYTLPTSDYSTLIHPTLTRDKKSRVGPIHHPNAQAIN